MIGAGIINACLWMLLITPWFGLQMIAPLYDKLSTELPHVRFYKVDIDRKVS